MKSKQLVAMAALALLVALPARAAEVVSSNIVGYTKLSLASGYTLLGGQFVDVGKTGLDMSIVASDAFETDDQIRFWTGSGYTTYVFYGEDADGGVYDTDGETCLGPGWGDDNQIVVSDAITPGTGFWLKTASSGETTLSGEVVDTTELEFQAGFNLLTNPRPVAIPLSKVNSTNLQTDDQIRFWKNGSYVTYVYYGEDADGGVYDIDGETCLGPGWGDDNQITVSTPIEIGAGFWLNTANSGTLVFGE